jgi:hypothetical protein
MFSVTKDNTTYTITNEDDFILACTLLDEYKTNKESNPIHEENIRYTLGELMRKYYNKDNCCKELNLIVKRLIKDGPTSIKTLPDNHIFLHPEVGISFIITEIYDDHDDISHITEMSLDDMWNKTVDSESFGDCYPQTALRFITEDYNNYYKPKQSTLGVLIKKYYNEIKDSCPEKLQSHIETLIKSKTDYIDNNYEIRDYGPVGIVRAPYYYTNGILVSINEIPLDNAWYMFVDVENWQEDAFPSKFEKNTVSELQVLKYILAEY